VVVGMTATEFSIADPSDPGMLDVAGFDAAVPSLVSQFARGM
jgi:60 kDa SS-A/Ro ribonucleoprotein